MSSKKPFSKDIILLSDVEAVANEIILKLQQDVLHNLKRLGAVIGTSGGIDSSVCLALTANAFGPERVLAIMMPEKDSSLESEQLAKELATRFDVKAIKEDITPALSGFKCYERRDEAVRRVFPEYNPKTHKMKIGIKQSGLSNNLPPIFSLTIIDSDGNTEDKILPVKEYLQIVAASNFKQRSRMTTLYYHAEALHYAVIGTPNKHEQEQGFFVKYGDGGADVMPIGNLYKTQVYQLANFLLLILIQQNRPRKSSSFRCLSD
jgi:NAD+ synthase